MRRWGWCEAEATGAFRFVPADAPHAFRPQSVLLGRRAGSYFEVRTGIDEGARIAVSGAFTLKSALSSGELSEGHEH